MLVFFLASRQLLIGSQDSCHLLDQSDGKVIHQTMTFSRVRTGSMKRSFFAFFSAACDVNAIQVNFLERVKTSFGFESLKGA